MSDNLDKFWQEVQATYIGACKIIASALGELNYRPHNISYGLLKAAAMIAVRTQCGKELFTHLAENAYIEEEILKQQRANLIELKKENDKNIN